MRDTVDGVAGRIERKMDLANLTSHAVHVFPCDPEWEHRLGDLTHRAEGV